MRTLKLNETKLWLVRDNGSTDEVDSNGNFTGEKIRSFSAPEEISISLYPNDGTINNDFSGTIKEFDFYAVTIDLDISKGDLLFYQSPVSNYDTTYDLRVSEKLKSINSTMYLFESR